MITFRRAIASLAQWVGRCCRQGRKRTRLLYQLERSSDLKFSRGMDEWTGPYACCDFEAASKTRASLSSRAPARRKRCASRLFSCSELPVFFPWRFLEICFWTFESATGIMAGGKQTESLDTGRTQDTSSGEVIGYSYTTAIERAK